VRQAGTATMRTLVVDDHPLMADALKTALAGEADVQTADNLQQAFELAAGEPAFDLVMLDLGLPGCSGVQALERFRERFPGLPVVVVSAANDLASITTAIDLGAMGFIPKTSPKDMVLQAVRLVASGGIYVPVEALKQRAQEPVAGAARGAPRSEEDLGLSPRQREVLSLLLKGLPNKLIARKLDISENTTKVHVSAVLHALGVSTRTQAVLLASRLGIRVDVRGGAP
jgi:DNA-binding NarL/FixJ family response regulator